MPDDLAAEVAEMRRLRALGRECYHSYKHVAAYLAPRLADAWEQAVATVAERDAEIVRLREEIEQLQGRIDATYRVS